MDDADLIEAGYGDDAASLVARRAAQAREAGLSSADREAMNVLGLSHDADRPALRRRYSELVRRYHPDRNGGDRSHEQRLQNVVDAYQHLRKARRFA